MAYFQARDGARLHYHDIGQGPVCVMLHGFGMASDLWRPLVWPLRQQQRFILLSQRGFGRSHQQSFSQDCIMSQLADDLADLIDHLQLEELRLVGYSMGACASMLYMSRYGDARVSRYLQIDQAACMALKPDWEWPVFGPEHQAHMDDLARLTQAMETLPAEAEIAQLPKPARQQICAAFADFIDVAGNKLWLRSASRLLKLEGLAKIILPTENWQIYIQAMRSYYQQEYDFREGIRELQIPIWSFVGSQSRMYPPEGQLRLSQFVKGPVKVVHFKGCGHALPFESPLRFSRQLGEFLQAA